MTGGQTLPGGRNGKSESNDAERRVKLEIFSLALSYHNSEQRALKQGGGKPEFPFAVHDVSLSLLEGEILAIMGANGCGKSTLLKGMARALKPNSGKVEFEGENIWALSPKQFASKVAYLPQSLQIPDDMKVIELINLGRNPHQKWWQPSSQMDGKERAHLAEVIEKLDLGDLQDRNLAHLSGGERQRAIIAMALSQRPSLLLMDEPLSGLDFRHQLEILEYLKDLRKDGLTIALVLHDLNFAAHIANRVALLQKPTETSNSLAALGVPSEVLGSAVSKSVFQVDIDRIETGDGKTVFYLKPENENS